MGFLKTITALFSSGANADRDGYWIYVRCQRCGEVIKTRVNLQQELNPYDEGGYIMRKTLVGSQLCFQRVEVILYFDDNRNLVNREIEQGTFIEAEEIAQITSAE